ncbi:Gag polyprotein [Dissostichus eleginoides]|uniref:Gag polyprotein n=1 Tax=Dissostichus eleginoides TaxID=100907 RepID=A0AAD9BQ26_DISEL|nr:Gag polyprotein [Dissostichus eleginoides]
MRLLDPDQLSSSIAILQELKRLYGRVTPVAQLRAQFFKCYQQEEETAASFLLRLRELFHQWEEVEPAGSAQDERTIRDQLVLGLRPGMVQQELQRQVRRNPTMSFREVSGEVKALETELRMESACASRVSVPQPRPAMAPSSLEEWRETVRTELRKEMKDQLSIITEEIRRQLSPQNAPVGHRDSTPPPNRLAQGRHNVSSPRQQRFEWDQCGQPICRGCGQAGHIQRNCQHVRGPLN